MQEVKALDLLEHFNMTLIVGDEGLERKIHSTEVHRPGFEMTGFFEYYPKESIQIIGHTEMDYFNKLTEAEQVDRARRLCTAVTPCIIVSNALQVPSLLQDIASRAHVPILQSPRSTNRVITHLTNYLTPYFAPATSVHGVLVDVSDVGVLITGQSGVGKSEIALELVRRGHRLIADDSVEIRQEDYDRLVGTCPPLIEHLLEIRGLGILNVMSLFGADAVKEEKEISYVVHLELWDDKKQYERLGIEEEKINILNVEVPQATVPVRPGRNLAVIIEVAAMNYRLRQMGINAAAQFSQQLSTKIQEKQMGNQDT